MGKELNFDLVDFDEAEEDALSLCDLAMDRDDDNDSKLDFDYHHHEDFFEFSNCSGDLSCSSSDSIMFCGKLISYNKDIEPILLAHDQNSYKNSNQFNKSKSISQPRQVKKKYNKTWSMSFSSDKINNGKLKSNKLDFNPVKKVSIIPTNVKSSSRWLFGVGRSPVVVEMELKDIKKRNTLRSNDEKNNNANGSDRRSKKGLWGLLNVLMFKKRHTTNQF